MKKDVLVKLISFAVALITVTVFTVFKSNEEKESGSEEASAIFGDFSSAIDKVSNLLELFLEAEGEEKIDEIAQTLSEELRRARQNYALLNLAKVESGLDTFLNLSGDFILRYADDAKQGQTSSEQRNKMESLKTVADRFSEELSKIRPKQSAEKITEEIRNSYVRANDEVSLKEESNASSIVSQSQPTQNEDSGNPLINAEQISEEQALEIAGAYIDTGKDTLTVEKTQKSQIDVFDFKNENEEICVSVSGGFVVSFFRNDTEDVKNFSDEQCIEKAKEFLSNYHSANFTPRYFESGEQTCTVVFTTKNGATYCNPDKVEIIVSKASGEIVAFSAEQFLLNHRNRTLQAPKHTTEEAQRLLSEELTVEQVWQVITEVNGNETMCFEFYCTTQEDGGELVYVNTQNLKVEGKTAVAKNKNFAFLK